MKPRPGVPEGYLLRTGLATLRDWFAKQTVEFREPSGLGRRDFPVGEFAWGHGIVARVKFVASWAVGCETKARGCPAAWCSKLRLANFSVHGSTLQSLVYVALHERGGFGRQVVVTG